MHYKSFRSESNLVGKQVSVSHLVVSGRGDKRVSADAGVKQMNAQIMERTEQRDGNFQSSILLAGTTGCLPNYQTLKP